jgi:hypothetical protein
VQPDLTFQLQQLARECGEIYNPGAVVVRVVIQYDSGPALAIPVPRLPRLPALESVRRQPADDDTHIPLDQPRFIPNAFQKAILAALDGKALRTDALGDAVNDRRRLFRDPGGLEELERNGRVAHHKRCGFYRPDSPPADLA